MEEKTSIHKAFNELMKLADNNRFIELDDIYEIFDNHFLSSYEEKVLKILYE